MTLWQLLLTLFYGSLASFALWGTWNGGPKRQVGVVLFGVWVSANIIYWTLSSHWRPILFPLLDVLFALTCAKAGKETGSRLPLVLIALSVLAVAMNTAFSMVSAHPGALYVYALTLNIIFAAQCLITGAWGKADELAGIVRLWRGNASARSPSQPSHGRSSDGG